MSVDSIKNEEHMKFLDIFKRINILLKLKKSVIISIDGNAGSGKTTLAEIINKIYDCNVFHMDDFFLTPELRTNGRLTEIGGNIDYKRFYKEVILGIKTDRQFKFQKYNCKKLKLDETIYIEPKRLNIIEGSYSMHTILIDNYDLKIFLSINKNQQMERILARNGPTMLLKFVNEWVPKENEYFEKMEIREKADLIL